jgi:beta-RFAP synthase
MNAVNNNAPHRKLLDVTNSAVLVSAGSRLHFGLLRTTAPFGGVGVMIDRPRTQVSVSRAEQFSLFGNERIRGIAKRYATYVGLVELPPCRIDVIEQPPEHEGLGSGTQLSLCVADALCQCFGDKLAPETIACEIAGRGARSAVGIHGYFHGGLLLEDAIDRGTTCKLNPIVSRVDVPTEWRVGLFRPSASMDTVFGDKEQDHFAKLREQAGVGDVVRRLQSIARDAMIPACAFGEFETFAESVERFNHESGSLFASVQGGPYNGAIVSDLIQTLKGLGGRGVGQTSWGPSVFCWFRDEVTANEILQRVPPEQAIGTIVSPLNEPRSIHVYS